MTIKDKFPSQDLDQDALKYAEDYGKRYMSYWFDYDIIIVEISIRAYLAYLEAKK